MEGMKTTYRYGYAIKRGPFGWFCKPLAEEGGMLERFGYSPNFNTKFEAEIWRSEKFFKKFGFYPDMIYHELEE